MLVRHGGGFLYRAQNDLCIAVAEPSLANSKKRVSLFLLSRHDQHWYPWWRKCELQLSSAAPLLPRKLEEMESIVTVVSISGGGMLQRDCGELDCRIGECNVTKGVHAEHL